MYNFISYPAPAFSAVEDVGGGTLSVSTSFGTEKYNAVENGDKSTKNPTPRFLMISKVTGIESYLAGRRYCTDVLQAV